MAVALFIAIDVIVAALPAALVVVLGRGDAEEHAQRGGPKWC
jgi:hypothetical protein